MPSTTWRSLWQTPVATVRTSTSRPSGLSISTASIVNGSNTLRKTAASICMGSSFAERILPAAGDVQCDAGDVARLVGGEEDSGVGDLDGLTHAAERRHLV